eukprot:136064-Prymnesium_polylepis.1
MQPNDVYACVADIGWITVCATPRHALPRLTSPPGGLAARRAARRARPARRLFAKRSRCCCRPDGRATLTSSTARWPTATAQCSLRVCPTTPAPRATGRWCSGWA